MAPLRSLSEATVEEVCKALGEELTGSQIGPLLARQGIQDSALGTKWRRLADALLARQRHDGSGNLVIAFVQEVMSPVRFSTRHEAFQELRSRMNRILAFEGLTIGDDGHAHTVQVARTLSEADDRARRLRNILVERGTHPDVVRFCRPELLADNYFHAVFEATKSVAEKLREKSGLSTDGNKLVDQALATAGGRLPVLAFNRLQTDTERSEQNGLANLARGMFGAFRNVAAHAPKVTWAIDRQDALDLLALASLLHRRLDAAVRTDP